MTKRHIFAAVLSAFLVACSGGMSSSEMTLPEREFFGDTMLTATGSGDYVIMKSTLWADEPGLAVLSREQNGRLSLLGTVSFPCVMPSRLVPVGHEPGVPSSIYLICTQDKWRLDIGNLSWEPVVIEFKTDYHSRAKVHVLNTPSAVYLMAEAENKVDFACRFDMRNSSVRAIATAPGQDVLWFLVSVGKRATLLYMRFDLSEGPESTAYDLSTRRRLHGRLECDWQN